MAKRNNLSDFNQLSDQEIEKAKHIYGMFQQFQKTAPSEVTNWMYGYAPNDMPGMFTEYTNDVISDLASGNDNVTNWIPKESADEWYDNVAHLSFITPEGFDGSKTYMQHLADSADIGECEFGDGADYQVYEYQSHMWRMSFSTESTPLSRPVGMKLHKRDSRKILRGARAGMTIDNEAEWMLAMLTERLEGHHRFNTVWGNPFVANANPDQTNNKNMSEGLDQTIRQGYVASRMLGGGQAVFADPIVVNGITITDVVAQLRTIIAVGTKIIERMRERGYQPTSKDVSLQMTSTHWRVYTEVLAAGALARLHSSTNNLLVTPGEVAAEIRRIQSSGGIEIAGITVPVITNGVYGRNEELADASGYGVIGDVYFLTRYYRGLNILAHRFLNWNNSDLADAPEERPVDGFETYLDGMVRTLWAFTNTTNTCWWYGMEMYHGLVCRMLPLQAKFMNFIVPADLENELESAEYWHQDFYAYDGERGGQGVALITGLGAV